jgi:hypothetical protein
MTADEDIARMVAAGPFPQRTGLKLLLTLARRPRGRALLRTAPLANEAAMSLLSMARYDDPAQARALGWDAEAVVTRGRELRRAEGRP